MTNHSQLEMNLQLFSEEVAETTESVETAESVEAVEETPEAAQETQENATETQEPFLKIKYNKEEVPLDYEKAIEYAQKGMNYDKVYSQYEELRQDPSFSFTQKQAEKYGMSVPEYIQAVEQAEYQEKLNELIQSNIPPELAEEVLESRKFREQFEAEKQVKAQEQRKQQEYMRFLETFPDVKPEEIPVTVWEAHEAGKSLVDAYTAHENQLLKEQLAKIQQAEETKAKNEQNAVTSTGSVTGQGTLAPEFFTMEQVERMSQKEVNKHWKTIIESQKHW